MATAEKSAGGLFYGWWVVSGCFFIYGFGAVINYSFTIYAPSILEEMHWTRSQFGSIYSAYLYVMLMLGVVAGWFVDRFGPRLSILIGSAVGAAGMVLFSTTQSMVEGYIYYAGIIGVAVVMQMALPTQTLARRWFLRRASLATGALMSSFGLLGAILFPLLAKMAMDYGWRPVMMWSGIAIETFVFIVALVVIKDSPESMGLHMDGMSDEEAKPLQGIVGAMPADEPHMTRGEALKTSQFWITVLSLALSSLVFMGFMGHITMIGLSVGMTAAQAALVMSAWALPSVVGRLGGGWVADRLGKRKAFMAFGFLIAVGYFYAWLFATSPTPLYIFAIWSGLVMSPILVILPPFFGDLFGRRHLASILGLSGLFTGAIAGIGPLVAGRIAEATNSYQLLYLCGALANILFVATIMLVKPTRVEQAIHKPILKCI